MPAYPFPFPFAAFEPAAPGTATSTLVPMGDSALWPVPRWTCPPRISEATAMGVLMDAWVPPAWSTVDPLLVPRSETMRSFLPPSAPRAAVGPLAERSLNACV